MRTLFAVYDEKDNFIDCGYSCKLLKMNYNTFWSRLHRNKQKIKSLKIFEIPLQPQNDIFKEEDERFLAEEGDNVYFDREIAEREGITLRTLYRRRKIRRKENEND